MNATPLRQLAIIVFLMAAFPALAQKKSILGIVTDSINNQRVSMAGVRNIYSGAIVLSRRADVISRIWGEAADRLRKRDLTCSRSEIDSA